VLRVVQIYRNCNRKTRKPMSEATRLELVRRAKEYEEIQQQKRRVHDEEAKCLMQKVLQACKIGYAVLPQELQAEVFPRGKENEYLNADLSCYRPELLYLEQVFRLFPKELYMRTFITLQVAQFITKLKKDKSKSQAKVEEEKRTADATLEEAFQKKLSSEYWPPGPDLDSKVEAEIAKVKATQVNRMNEHADFLYYYNQLEKTEQKFIKLRGYRPYKSYQSINDALGSIEDELMNEI
jgi:hypothetical protein